MKILLVDDHPLFLQGLKFLIGDLHSELAFYEASDCASALECLNEDDVDLILLDYHLAGEPSKEEALLAIKHACSSATLVVLSSEDNPELIHSAVDAGAAGFIPKSSTPEILMAALQLVLAGGVYLPPEASRLGAMKSEARNAQAALQADDFLGQLSDRQADVLMGAIRGKPNKIIARELDIAEGTVKAHLSAAFRLLNVKNRTEAVYKAAELGLRL